MKRKFLEELGLEKEVIDKIMAENGNDINAAKADYESLKQQLETANQQVTERDKQLEQLKKNAGDNEELSSKIAELQAENKETKAKYEADLKELKLSAAIQTSLVGKVHDEELVSSLFDKSKLILSEDGKVTGLEEQLKQLKETKGFLFKEEVKEPPKTNYRPKGGQTHKEGFAAQMAEQRNEAEQATAQASLWSAE